MNTPKLTPEQEAPKKFFKVGDTLVLNNNGYYVSDYNENEDRTYHLHDGNQIIEVEVKSVKTVKLILE